MIVFRELKLLGMIFGNNIIYNIHLGHDGTTSLRWKMQAAQLAGADPGFFLGGGALVSCSTSTPINHIVFFFAEYQLYQKTAGHLGGGGGGAHLLHPPPRSAPEVVRAELELQFNCPLTLFYCVTPTKYFLRCKIFCP